MDQQIDKISQQITLWYELATPRQQDVLGDFAGRELCAIHGESLLLYSLEEAKVDFQGGLQMLHAVHAVENFLSKLQSRGCNFHIVWFDDHEGLLLGASRQDDDQAQVTDFNKRRLARAVLIQHLRLHSQSSWKPLSFHFASMDSDEYRLYLSENPLRLFFVSDDQTNKTKNYSYDGKMTFQSIIYRLNTEGYTVALLDDIEFQSSEVRATLYSATRGLDFDKDCWQEPLKPASRSSDVLADTQCAMNMMPDGVKLSVRELVCMVSLSTVLKNRWAPEQERHAAAFIVHLAILKHCCLVDRPRYSLEHTPQNDSTADSLFIDGFCESAAAILESRVWEQDDRFDHALSWDAFDLVDGRLFFFALDCLGTSVLPPEVGSHCQHLSTVLQNLCGKDVSGYFQLQQVPASATEAVSSPPQSPVLSQSLLPFRHKDFDAFLKEVAVTEDTEAEHAYGGNKVFEEATHWHNTKKLVTLNKESRLPSTDVWALRRNQRFMAEIQSYAASLTNVAGNILQPETIVVDPPGKTDKKLPSRHKQAIPHKKAPVKNDKTHLLEREQQQRQQQKQAKSAAEWRTAYDVQQQETNQLKKYAAAIRFQSSRSRADLDVVGPDVALFVCSILCEALVKDTNMRSVIESNIVALIWDQLQRLSSVPVSSECSEVVEALARTLGFSSTSLGLTIQGTEEAGMPPLLSKRLVLNALQKLGQTASVRPSVPVEFQLASCGPYLRRGFDSQADGRVSGFHPDRWQREVLDTIDARQSLFVVAPTSAGKTFISFYAMKQVLKHSDDGVIVYVAPTKALVNQVAAEIQGRFSKKFASFGGQSVWAIKTRDYRINNPTGCQVLVTVPHMLQILLLSPSSMDGKKKNPWPTRLRWIIFDEVHSIGQSDEGVVWEQLVLMAPCPIIALSATVGNPLEFQQWLEGCEKAKGRELRMIAHSSRYSDLRNYLWRPSAGFRFDGFAPVVRWPIPGLEADGYNNESPFLPIHPVSSLTDRSRDILDDVNLEPRDCLALWKAMRKHQTEAFPVDPSLDPTRCLPAAVGKADVVVWEVRLKQELIRWMHDHRSPFLAVKQELSPPSMAGTAHEKFGTARMLELLTDLRTRGALPALIFIYDRGLCEHSVHHIVAQLQAAEETWKQTSREWAKTMSQYEKHKKEQAKARGGKEKTTGKKRRDNDDDDSGVSKLDSMRETASQEASRWASFDPDAPLDRFSLADSTKLTKSELEESIGRLAFANIKPFLLEGLRRGVGVHHAGMNRRYRVVVEKLFRRGFLSAVVATGTLALGINMPCKTVVFGSDSTYLNALNFRQGSGRAGRRGFDILGNVVFYDFPGQRVRELVVSRLPDLRGHFPVSTTLLLRTLTLDHLTEGCAYARQLTRSLFAQTRMYLGGPSGQLAIKHHVRFSIEYLRRQHLLSATGQPLNLAGLVSHLYFAENAAFALHGLLQSGYLHRLCADIHLHEAEVLQTLVLVLSHLFCRRPCRRHTDQAWLDSTVRPSSSVVLLPPLPAEAEAALRAHNAGTLSIFRTYVQTYVRQHLAATPDNVLPLTKRAVVPDRPVDLQGLVGGSSRSRSSRTQQPVELRSPFAALSGFTDEFASVRELCATARSGVFLEASSVPYLSVYPLDTDGVPFNAYIYDFFRHGDVKALKTGNGIREGDVWFDLQDFSLVLATVVTSLTNFLDPTARAADLDDDVYNSEDSEGRDVESRVESRVSVPASTASSKSTKKTKKVVDSWEDDDDDDDDEKTDKESPPSSVNDNGSLPVLQGSGKGSLYEVRSAFALLKAQFDEKFLKMWA